MKTSHGKHKEHRAGHGDRHEQSHVPVVDDAAITESLHAIYGEERDDLQTVAQAPSRLTRFLIRTIALLFVLCGAVAAGYVVYERWFAGEQDGKPLAMSIEMADDIQSGTLTTIELRYANQTNAPLTAVGIDVNVPAGFLLSASEPAVTNGEDLSWDLGTIGAHSDGKIVITGMWVVDVPSTTGVQAIATYKPANFNAQFHDIATKTVSTTTSTTVVAIDAPLTANVGEAVTYTVRASTTGTETIEAPKVMMTLPEGFFVSSSEPGIPAGGSTEWMLSELVPGAEQTIVVTGTFASDADGARTMIVVSGVPGSRFSPQATATAVTEVKPSALALTMVANGGTGTVSADPGSVLRVSLRLDNASDAAIADATAILDFTAEDNIPITWPDAVLDGGRITAKGIVFDAAAIGSIPAGGHALLNLAFPLKADLSAVSSEFAVAFTATRGAISISATPLTVELNSDAAVAMTLRYFDGDGSPLGSGPLPPKVGSATHYRAVWAVNGGSHGIKDVTISATLPEGVTWDDFSTTTSGSMSYDSSTRVVRWTIASLPANGAQVSARMSVSITPTVDDVGLEKTVIGKAVLNAKDAITGATIERFDDAVTTACEGDALAAGKGVVKNN
jgi:hypothetical protein